MEEAQEKLKSLKLTATRLALFERKLGKPLTRLTDNDLGMQAFVALLESAGLTDKEIDDACEALGIEEFSNACLDVLMNSGLFKQAKNPAKPAPAPTAK